LGIPYTKVTPETVASIEDAIGWIRSVVKSKQFKTLVIDDLTQLVQSEWLALQRTDPKAFEYGAFRAANIILPTLDKFMRVLRAVNDKHEMNVIALGHTFSAKEKQAHEETFNTNHLNMHEVLRNPIYALFDSILFAETEDLLTEVGEGKAKRVVGDGSGERVLHCSPSSSWKIVKNAHHLPDTLPMNGFVLQEVLAKTGERKEKFMSEVYSNKTIKE
jgi:hypothetical protein